jgi:uncharacterized membrane protein
VTRAAPTALVAVALVAAVWGVLHVGWYSTGQIVDYGVYQTYGDRMAHEHAVPYRDFDLEYPPAALPVFVAPALVDSHVGYRKAFRLLMAVLLAACALAALAIGGLRAAVLTAVAPLALGSVVVSRFDFWPAALAVAALAFLLRERVAASAMLMGTAFAAKLWPAVLVPVAVIWLVKRAGGAAALRWLAAAVATAAVWFLPFLALSPGGVAHSFHAQLARPLQLESLGSAVLIAVHHAAGSTLHVSTSFGSQNVTGPGAHALAIATSALGGLALLALYAAFARGEATDADLLRYGVAAVAVTIAFGKVFSPQFLIWLVPLVPLVRGLRGLAASALFLVTCVLTQLWFPHRYWALANSFAAAQSWELLARDLSVLALVAVLAWPRLQHDALGEHRARIEALQRVRTQVD